MTVKGNAMIYRIRFVKFAKRKKLPTKPATSETMLMRRALETGQRMLISTVFRSHTSLDLGNCYLESEGAASKCLH